MPSGCKLGNNQLVESFRHSVPYVNAHRGKTFVIMLGGEAIEEGLYRGIINDVALLYSLGIRLILVYGARPQINAELAQRNQSSQFHHHIRITDEPTFKIIRQICGALQFDITARLSMGLSNTPMQGAQINVVSGNFVIAQPVGVKNGVDYCLSGKIRRVDIKGIKHQLDKQSIVLLGPIAVSVTGESFNLTAEEVATEVAIQLGADKMIGFSRHQGLLDEQGKVISELMPDEIRSYLQKYEKNICTAAKAFSYASLKACHHNVSRCHLISYQEDGSLLQELFTREGVGTQIVTESAEKLRQASISDIGGVLDLIRPLEQKGILVRRSREQLEIEIERFMIIERDNLIIGCAAFYPFEAEKAGEFACLAVHPSYRDADRGSLLLDNIISQARDKGYIKLFALTTSSIHWFQEKGFNLVDLTNLPAKKQQLYNLQRCSKILELDLN